LDQGKKILICYATSGEVRQEFVESLLQVVVGLSENHEVSVRASVGGPMIAKHRNMLAKSFLEDPRGWDYLLFVDSDMAFRTKDVLTLLKANKPIIGGLYFGIPYGSLERFVVALKTDENGSLSPIPVGKLPKRGSCRVNALGMGFTLIKREVIETLGPDHEKQWPFAETLVDGKGRGEDVTFCLRAKEAGFLSWLCVDARVGHIKSFTI
jgi:GT2 family glycosyltransferase